MMEFGRSAGKVYDSESGLVPQIHGDPERRWRR